MTHTPTPEQQAILDHQASKSAPNLMINALAGTGKSATLKMLDLVHKTKPAIYLVFNVRNKDEALKAQKSGEFSSTTIIKNFNGCGHGIWAKAISGNIALDKQKTRNIWRGMIDDMSRPDAQEAWSYYSVVLDGIERAKAIGYVPTKIKFPHKSLITATDLSRAMDEIPSPEALALIDELLTISIKQAYDGVIDFNDQIYMPALFGGVFPKFPRVMVDEYQDQNPVTHEFIRKLVGDRRLIGVGDPLQNIYGFRGAKAAGMESAIEQYSMDTLPLSVSFRCPQAIVENARWHAPTFQWTKPGGSVETPNCVTSADIADGGTIICRNNAPLLRMAFKLISVGRSVTVVGSELGPRLIAIMKKLGDATMTRKSMYTTIEEWREARLVAGSKSANDLADCMRVFAEHGDTLSTAISYAEHIFAQSGTIQLVTGHKSKGLEYDDVYFLDEHLLDDRDQDLNLRYVIQTRSQNKLTMLDSSRILW